MKRKPNLIYLQLVLVLAVMFLTIYSTYSVVAAKAYQPELDKTLEEAEPLKQKQDYSENIKLSREINEFVKSIEGVSDSVCFVMFDQCYVAFKCENLVDKDAIRTLKKEIAGKVHEKFDKVKRIFISNDLNAFVKMEKVVKSMEAGEPITGLKQEIIELRKLFHGNRQPRHFKKKR